MRKIIVTRDPAKINLAVLKLVEQLGDLTSLSALASDAEYARSQAVAAAAAAQADQTAAAAAKAGAEAAQASAASSSGTAGAHASAAAASAATALLARDEAAVSKAGSDVAQAASEGARDASIIAKDQSQAAKTAAEAARDVVQSSIYIGPTAPTVTRSGMVWVDETANDIKIRNADNTAWLLLSDMIGALEYDRAQTLTDTQKLRAAVNIGAVVYSQAHALTEAQRLQARANIGLETPALAGQALGIVSNGGSHLDFRTASGQTWRLMQSAVSKANGGVSSLTVSFGFTFLTIPTVVISNGNGLAVADIMLSAYSVSGGGFEVGSRNSGGMEVTGAYQVNYMALGRIS